MESISAIRRDHRVRRAELVNLCSLLDASDAALTIQNELAARLLAVLRETHPAARQAGGYDDSFGRVFAGMRPEQRELHHSELHALRPTNQALLEWVRRDTFFKAQAPNDENRGRLATQLAGLEAHLILWRAKYETAAA